MQTFFKLEPSRSLTRTFSLLSLYASTERFSQSMRPSVLFFFSLAYFLPFPSFFLPPLSSSFPSSPRAHSQCSKFFFSFGFSPPFSFSFYPQRSPSFAFARQVTVRRIPPRPLRDFPEDSVCCLTSVHHPSARSSMISSFRRSRPRYVIADRLGSLARSLALTGSRRSGYLGSAGEAKLGLGLTSR